MHVHGYMENKILPKAVVKKRLSEFPWTKGTLNCYTFECHAGITDHEAYTIVAYVDVKHIAELKDGRIPHGLTHWLGYWKAEELQKFTFPATECVLGECIFMIMILMQ